MVDGTQSCGFGVVSYFAAVCYGHLAEVSIYLFTPGAVQPFSTAHQAVAQIIFNDRPKVKNLLELLMLAKEAADVCQVGPMHCRGEWGRKRETMRREELFSFASGMLKEQLKAPDPN